MAVAVASCFLASLRMEMGLMAAIRSDQAPVLKVVAERFAKGQPLGLGRVGNGQYSPPCIVVADGQE